MTSQKIGTSLTEIRVTVPATQRKNICLYASQQMGEIESEGQNTESVLQTEHLLT